MMALAWVKVTIFWFSLCFTAIPTSAQIMTRLYAMSFLVAKTRTVIINATIMIRVAYVSALIPKPSQFTETKKTDTLAIEAIVIQPK